ITKPVELRYCIKFRQKLDNSQSETISGCTSVESDLRSGRPQTSRNAIVVERVENPEMEGRRLTVREITDKVGLSKNSAYAILRD
ncbi:hypothetical protein FHG87_012646, partial [Trinorchestia longiramus]